MQYFFVNLLQYCSNINYLNQQIAPNFVIITIKYLELVLIDKMWYNRDYESRI